jgi:alpha-beta hydrolase superfamily lysophospholipase
MMPDPAELRPAFALETGWRRIQALLPEQLQLELPGEPIEEWLTLGSFSVHLDCWRRHGAPATLVLVHGGGGNSRLLAPYGVMAATAGYEVVAPDLPGYGLTQVPKKRALAYEDWRDTVAGVLEAQARHSERPIIIFGMSMGGMLAYDATARTCIPNGLIATCLLDTRDAMVRRSLVRWPWMTPVMEGLFSVMPWLTDRLSVPMRVAGNMRGIANDPKLAQAISSDPRAGGNWMPGRFLRTYVEAGPLVEPEVFDVCPVLLAHPGDDRWTDLGVSRTFFERLRVPKQLVMLEKAGHFPVEEPGVTQLRTALLHFLAERSHNLSE